MKNIFFFLFLLLVGCQKSSEIKGDVPLAEIGFVKGADISWVTEMEDSGRIFRNIDGAPRECTALMKDLGMNAIRLRVWVNPKERYNSVDDVVAKALRAKRLGMAVMIDFHYSDSWADPGKQTIPVAWRSCSYDELEQMLRLHTIEVLTRLAANGVEPHWVQVGNEVSDGMLWPMGKASVYPEQYAGLIAAGAEAVRSVFPKAKIIVHLNNGFDKGLYQWNLDILRKYKVRFDGVGMSLYPFSAVGASYWDPQCQKTKEIRNADEAVFAACDNMKYIHLRYSCPVMVSEVGVPVNDPAGGRKILKKLFSSVVGTPFCNGIFYWEPECYNWKGYSLGAFGNDGRATEILEPFGWY